MNETEAGFQYVHLDQVDPNFTLIDDGFYNLKLLSAERKTFDKTATGGSKGEFIKFGFAVTGSGKFSGRRVYPEALFLNDFNLKVLRRIQDASGVQQNGNTDEWLKKLTAIGPVMRLKVEVVPDVDFKTGQPKPATMKPDGTAAMKQIINWKAGIQPEGIGG
jgi:hypothetical protein